MAQLDQQKQALEATLQATREDNRTALFLLQQQKKALEADLLTLQEQSRTQLETKDRQIRRLEGELQPLRKEFGNSDIAKVDGVTSSLFVALYERAWEDMRLFVRALWKASNSQLSRPQCLKVAYDVLFVDFSSEYFGLNGSGLSPPDRRRANFEQV
jgi:hypothetical protein